MVNKTLLSLDMSTTCTGWSFFNADNDTLTSYGLIKPSTKGIAKLTYPLQQLTKMIDIAKQIRTLIENLKPSRIVIEEIAGSKNRIGQKVLDGLHWVVLMHIQEYIDILEYYDVSGESGWRTDLKLKLSDADKAANKEAKKLNPQLASKQKLPVYDAKDLAARYANDTHGLTLDPQTTQTDADLADSICIGTAYLKFKFPRN